MGQRLGKENQKVQIQILSEDDWKIRFDRALKAIRAKTAGFSTEEIEKDTRELIKAIKKSLKTQVH